MTHEDQNDIDEFFSTARVQGREGSVELAGGSYQNYLYDLDDPVLARYRGMSYEEFTADRQASAEFLRELLAFWDSLLAEPFVGVTNDGVVREGVWKLPDTPGTDAAASAAAERLLSVLSPQERERVSYSLDAPERRAWSNPEFVFHRNGIRLEDTAPEKVDAVLQLLKVSLSPEGYARVMEAMDLNGYLGELVDLPAIMNNRSYWFSLFGTPDADAPWGWQLFGHHVCLNYASVGGREVIAPIFIGAEPALSDGLRPPLFDAREHLAIELAESLSPEQRADTVVYASVLDPAMPEGRLHPADERSLAGAFRDNRVIPYEGINVSRFTEQQRALLRRIVEDFMLLLKQPQRDAWLAEYDAHIDDTWLAWYGDTDGSGPFYFRVQSPVIVAELDHHAGVWLNNRLPARFHVHSNLRMPNGNDYGNAFITQWKAAHAE